MPNALATRRSATPEVESPQVVTAEEIAEFLNSPHTLLEKRFQNSPPPDEYRDYKGKWEMYGVQMTDGEVEHEYQILLEELDGAPLPMGQEEIRFLLMHSALVV